jgi:hypothetical protein
VVCYSTGLWFGSMPGSLAYGVSFGSWFWGLVLWFGSCGSASLFCGLVLVV